MLRHSLAVSPGGIGKRGLLIKYPRRRVSVRPRRLSALFRLAFTSVPGLTPLNLAGDGDS